MGKKATRKASKRPPAKRPAPKPAPRTEKGSGGVKALQDFCRSLPGVTEDVKWEDMLTFLVGDKIFAGFSLSTPGNFGFKSEEEEFMGLIQKKGIIPSPYLAKHFWVAVRGPTTLSEATFKRLLQKSHSLVLAKLSKRKQQEILQSAPSRASGR